MIKGNLFALLFVVSLLSGCSSDGNNNISNDASLTTGAVAVLMVLPVSFLAREFHYLKEYDLVKWVAIWAMTYGVGLIRLLTRNMH